MQRASILLSVRHGWPVIIVAGMVCFGASFAILHITNFNPLSFMAALPAKTTDSMMLALVGVSAAGAFVIYRLNGQDRLMTAALNNMPQGLCMFHSSARHSGGLRHVNCCGAEASNQFFWSGQRRRPASFSLSLASIFSGHSELFRRQGRSFCIVFFI